MFVNKVSKSTALKPVFNLGCLFDYPTGRPVIGAKGETIINGGLHHTTGITGEANSVKTGNSLQMMMTVLARYGCAEGITYDTEGTMPVYRPTIVARGIDPALVYTEEEIAVTPDVDENSIKRHAFTDITEYPDGSKFFSELKEYGRTRPRLKADFHETPFVDANGERIKILAPTIGFIDSLSMFSSASVIEIQDRGDAGSSARNIEALRDNMAKNQMVLEFPKVTGANGIYLIMTAHLGKQHQLDPHAPPRKQLSYLKPDLKLKNVPEKFNFLVHNLWFLFSMKPLINRETKAAEFPRDSDDNKAKGDSDLQIITCLNLRGKSGVTGYNFDIILSQTEGLLPSLSEFYHCKKNKFGFGGNDRNYYLELRPDEALSRTTVRRKLKESNELRTAARITADLLQMKQLWHFLPEGLWCDAATLYQDIKAKGYDWEVLLNTRGYWTFDQYTNPIPFLSTMDLLKMRQGTYKPYWYKGEVK